MTSELLDDAEWRVAQGEACACCRRPAPSKSDQVWLRWSTMRAGDPRVLCPEHAFLHNAPQQLPQNVERGSVGQQARVAEAEALCGLSDELLTVLVRAKDLTKQLTDRLEALTPALRSDSVP
jgi:hypothetical protein